MNLEQIKELIGIVEKSAITSFELEESGYRIRIGKEKTVHQKEIHDFGESFQPGSTECGLDKKTARSADIGFSGLNQAESNHPSEDRESEEQESEGQNSKRQNLQENHPEWISIKSPMLGVFYSSSAPDRAPFVKIGDRIKKGDVLCIIEAMKLMNEILSEKEGELVEICLENGQIAEYGQTLFILR